MPPRVTLRDLAARTGLHFTTVSLALRNSPRLLASTRRKVLRAARAMGYRPDPMLAALNAYRRGRAAPRHQATLAWIVNWPRRGDFYGCEEFKEYHDGALERARERGYVLEEFWLHEPGMSIPKLHRILDARNIQGVLLPPQPRAGRFLDLDYARLSALAFGYSMQPPVLHTVTNHHTHSMGLLLTKLADLGYRRIGLCIEENWDEKVEGAWTASLLVSLERRRGQARIPACWDRFDDEELRRWLRRHRPDAVVGPETVARRIRAMGWRIPRDLGFASLFLPRKERCFSGIHQNDRLIGAKAVDLVVDMLHRGERGIPETPIRTLVEGVWFPGRTLRPQRQG
jgi:LacI family transcriptional regulator